MKKTLRLMALLLALCIAAASLPREGFAAGGGTTHTVADQQSVSDLLASGTVENGDTIQITGTGSVKPPSAGGSGTDTPWVVDKAVTITGGTLNIQAGGIILGADVTFKDISLSFTSNVRNAVIANGHTLTLENVTCGNHSFNLFCGGLLNSNNEQFTAVMPAPGSLGTIRIKGSTSLQKNDTFGSGNIYAGNLCMGGMDKNTNGENNNGPANVFNGSAVITVEGGSSGLGTVYACGAQQRIPVEASSGKVTLPDAAKYTVSGAVTVSGNVPDVEGAGSGGGTSVTYRDDGTGYLASRVFSHIGSLSVETGNLELKAGSHDLDGVNVSVASGAKLNLAALAWRLPTIGNFTGGGFLVLHKNQTLSISGAVAGTASVAIGGVNNSNEYSTDIPVAGHCYIQAPTSQDGAFRLLPYASQPDMTLVRDENGNWTIPGGSSGGDTQLVDSFQLVETSKTAAPNEEVEFPLTVAPGGIYLEYIPLEITVGNTILTPSIDEYGYCTYADDLAEFAAEVNYDIFYITAVKAGTYTVTIAVPAEHTSGGSKLTQTATLTVTDGTTPVQPVQIPVPQANDGLVWTGAEQTGVNEGIGYTLTGHRASDAGSYTAAAVLRSGYQWADGTQEDKSIPWSIAKSTVPPAAPGGLAGIAPTSAGGADGRITGTTLQMEYSAGSDFSDPLPCGAGETAGLAAGTYYVRLKDSGNQVAGAAASVTVPAYGAPRVTGISIQTSASKTSYQVGDALDVSGLTLRVEYSDGSSRTVAVTADMVTGFDSSQSAASQTLTITYAGQTASYEVRITEAENPDPDPNPDPEHRHSWSAVWTVSPGYHWHNCAAAGCPILDNSRKEGYAPHTAGPWVVDRAPDALHSGSRHRSCTVCGYEMVREVIPATGGGSFGGGTPSGSGSLGGSPSGGSSSGGGTPSNMGTVTNTVQNPNGSTTTTATDKATGTVTETTRHPDGGTVTVETRTDGTVTTVETAADGSSARTIANPDGSRETSVRRADGTTAYASTDVRGRMQAQVSLSEAAVRTAQGSGAAVSLPIPAVSTAAARDAAPVVEVRLPGGTGAVRVEIPVQSAAPGVVAVIVNPDGSETVVKTAFAAGDGIELTLEDSAAVKIVDNSTIFSDVPASSWAREAADFVSARGIFRGTGDGTFSPNGTMTRGMLAVVLHNLEDGPAHAFGGSFADAGESWYTDAVYWAAEQGIIGGYGNGMFGPNDDITREQLAVMLWRYAGSPAASGGTLGFADGDRASGYALEALRWAEESGILGGDGSGRLDPQGLATRAQAAQMLMRFIQNL